MLRPLLIAAVLCGSWWLAACSSDSGPAAGPGGGGTSSTGPGGTGGTGLSGGGGGGSPEWALAGEELAITWGATTLRVDPNHGARVVSLRVDDRELLLSSTVDPANYGSTYWTSPQSDWNWPPIAAIDSEPYEYVIDGCSLTLTSGQATIGNRFVTVEKHFTVDPSRDLVAIEYGLTNQTDSPVSFASWEVTRVWPAGLTFFPEGSDSFTPNGLGELPVTTSSGISWFDHSAFSPGSDCKLHADGSEGWLAHATSDLLFIKAFADLPANQAAPGEAEVEIYAAGSGQYVEVEAQGAYLPIAAGSSSSYAVTWLVRPITGGATAQVGDSELVAQVRAARAALRSSSGPP